MTKERLFKKEYAKELVSVAKSDLKAAQILAKSDLKRQELVLFHVQQAIEKSLKAILCWQGKPVPMVHSLSIIIDRLPNSEGIPDADSLEDLTQFATIRRYEEGVALFSPEEIDAALAQGQQILLLAESKLV